MQDREVRHRLVFGIPSQNLRIRYLLSTLVLPITILSMIIVQHWTRKHSKQCGRAQSPMEEEQSQNFSSDILTLNSELMASIPLRG
jgi:hypothetical protein